MKVVINNTVTPRQCFTLVGEMFENGQWKSKHRVDTILPGDHEIEFETNSYFSSPSGFLVYVSDDKKIWFTIIFKSNRVLACCGTEVPDARELLYRSSLPGGASDAAGYFLKSDGCYWGKQNGTEVVKITVFGEDASSLTPAAVAEHATAEHVQTTIKESPCPSVVGDDPAISEGVESQSDQLVSSTSVHGRKLVRIVVENAHASSFKFDGDFLDHGKWNISPTILPGRSTTTLELISDSAVIGQGVVGCCWFVSASSSSPAEYLSFAFSHKPLHSPRFKAWAGKAPMNIKDELHGGLCHVKTKQVVLGQNLKYERRSKSGANVLVMNVAVADMFAIPVLSPKKTTTSVTAPTVAAVAAVPSSSTDIVAVPEHGEAEESLKAGQEMLTDFMNSTRPKHALSGLTSGLKYMGSGVVAGAATLVTAPVLGAKSDGAVGLMKGLAKGVGGFVGMSVAGVAAGLTQVVRGVVNTPEAFMKGTQKDFKWDKETGEWVKDVYDLGELFKTAEQEEADSDNEEREWRSKRGVAGVGGRSNGGVVKETGYYDVLGVSVEATSQEIKRAYYKKAVAVHPDKNRENPEANQQFQQLSQAYKVLSDEPLRARYDAQGAKEVEEGSAGAGGPIDVGVFVGALFGSLKFEQYVGELSLTGFAKQMMGSEGGDEGGESHWARSRGSEKRRQKRRIVFTAMNLVKRLEMYVDGRDEVAFVQGVYLEAAELARTSFGPQLLAELAWCYTHRSEKFLADELGLLWTKKMQSWKSTSHNYANMAAMAGSVTKSLVAVNKLSSSASQAATQAGQASTEGGPGETPGDMADMKKQMEESLPTLLSAALVMCIMDISETVKQSAKMVLKDLGVSWQVRMRRAHAMRRLGRIFEEVANAAIPTDGSAEGGADVVKKLEEAFVATIQASDKSHDESS